MRKVNKGPWFKVREAPTQPGGGGAVLSRAHRCFYTNKTLPVFLRLHHNTDSEQEFFKATCTSFEHLLPFNFFK
jgi:hypothetical protein